MSSREVRTRTGHGVLTDTLRESPVDLAQSTFRRRAIRILLLILALIVIGLVVSRFRADRPVDYADAAAHFKWGSIGSEPGGPLLDAVGGLLPPEPIFVVLPRICPDLLPGGYASLGFIFEEGHALPVGISQRFRLGFPQVGLNCAVCHTGSVRASTDSERQVIPGMPSHQLHLRNFFRFVLDCTLDERFTADNVLGRMAAAGYEQSSIDALLYRLAVIPRTREQTLNLQKRLELIMGDKVTEWGHGRVDTFNPYKSMQFNWRLRDLPLAELTGASDFPSLWNQKPREGMELHWDGNNASLLERNLSASLGAGVTPTTVDHDRLKRVRDWIETLPPPPWPFGDIDPPLAARGQELYHAHCQSCHADHTFKEGRVVDAPRVGKVEALAAVGTDPYRLNSYTATFAANQYTLYPASPYRFTHFRKTDGYANQPLDGVWARAPYLHNGAVPTMRDLLDVPEARPTTFHRGYDVYDAERMGFVADVAAEGGVEFTRFDTRLPGNGNSGHLWGTDLPAADKDAIVEYMKRF